MEPAQPFTALPIEHQAVLTDYLNPSLSLPELAAAHNLSLVALLTIISSEPFLAALKALEEAANRRLSLLHAASAMSALATIAADGDSPLERRRAAVPLLRFISRRIPTWRAPRPSDTPGGESVPDAAPEAPILCRVAFEPIAHPAPRPSPAPAATSTPPADAGAAPAPAPTRAATPPPHPAPPAADRVPERPTSPVPTRADFPRRRPGRPTPDLIAAAAGNAGPGWG